MKLKRIATALVLGSLIAATQAASADSLTAFPDQSQPDDGNPTVSTYADAHANDPVRMTGSAIPDQSQPDDGNPTVSTYADSHLKDPVRTAQPVQSSTYSIE